MFLLYLIILFLALLSSWFILWRVPFLKKSTASEHLMSSVSIIIPARNEEHNLPILLESLKQQSWSPLEILVVDDESDDQTALVASEMGAKVLPFDVNDTGWVGKSAACWYGAKQATGDLLLFLDADIFLPHVDSLEKIIGTFEQLGQTGALSIQPYHVIKKGYENFSAVFNIMVLAGMNNFSFLGYRLQPAGAFGPSLLCNKETYFKIGGHQLVKDSIMENVDFGGHFLKHHLPVHLFGGKDSLHFRMYPEGLKSLAEGWSKSFASGSKATHPLLLVGTSFWITGAFITFLAPFYFLVIGNTVALAVSVVGYLLFSMHLFRMTHNVGNFQLLAILFYPLLFLYFVALFGWSIIKTYFFKEVSWKGRKIKT